jgi:hypothetical protein
VRSRFVQPTANGGGLASAGEASNPLHPLLRTPAASVPCTAAACNSPRPLQGV